MKRLLLFFIFLVPFFVFGQVLKMNAWYMPDKSTNFPQTMPVYSLIFVGSIDTLYSVTASYTTADDMNQVIADGNYVAYPSSGGGDTSYFDFASQRITTKTGITSMQSDTIVTAVDLYITGQKVYRNNTLELISDNGVVKIESGSGTGDGIQLKVSNTVKALLNYTGNFTFGDNTAADSTVDVHGGMEVDSDILVGGGWAAWTPSLTWGGGTPGAPTVVARYEVTNNRVNFVFDIQGANDSGSTITSVSLTPPVTIADINAIPTFSAGENNGALTQPTRLVVGLIDAESAASRKISVTSLSINNTNDYRITGEGFYEILGK